MTHGWGILGNPRESLPLTVIATSSGSGTTGGNANSFSTTLSRTPVDGNLLMAVLNISQFLDPSTDGGESRTVTPPAGWTFAGSVVSVNVRLALLYKVVSGDSPTVVWNITGTPQTHSGAMVEIQGASSLEWVFDAPLTASGFGLSVGGFVQNLGVFSGSGVNSISTAGWTTDQNTAGVFHATVIGHGPLVNVGDVIDADVAWGAGPETPHRAMVLAKP